MRPRPALVTALALPVLLLGLAACGDAEPSSDVADGPAEPDSSAPDDAADGDDATGSDLTGDDALEPLVERAIDALVADEGVDRDAVELVSAARVIWSDGALGCPAPDMMYTQALVDGYRIVLAVDGAEVAFHGADGEAPFRCDDPQPPVG
jgi:hypothetical protein